MDTASRTTDDAAAIFPAALRHRDFSGCDLTGKVFCEADLSSASFERANLEGARFLRCYAAEANFRHANCRGLHAEESNFYRADFRHAELADAVLLKCVLAAADFTGAHLRRLSVTLDCNTFEDVRLGREAGLELAYLFGRARSPQQNEWRRIIGERDCARLARMFLR
ncbi:MAG TPA: pentapeptide repeat-containing protein [Candidatus Nitrosotenuis sp.]|nr:pentapeptide repeat-containing protein [Candidatus Nitrosotenuis sp.]